MQVAEVCVVMEADQQCELEALSNWLGTHPRLWVSVRLWGEHAVWQAGLAPKPARIALEQLGQRQDILLIASCLAAPELPLITTL